MRLLKRIVEFIFIFLVPLMLLLFGLKINKEYDENNNLINQYLTYENGIFREYNDNLEYKYTIDNFNIFNEEWEIGSLNWNTGQPISNDNFIRSKNYILVEPLTTYYVITPGTMNGLVIYTFGEDYSLIQLQISSNGNSSFTFSTVENVKYIKFRSYQGFTDVNIKGTNINISSVFNGNYASYGESLLVYSNDNYSSDYTSKDYNFTWYNYALVKLSDTLQFNNNFMIQFIFIYVIMICLNLLLWYVFYVPFDMLFGLLLRKLDYYK